MSKPMIPPAAVLLLLLVGAMVACRPAQAPDGPVLLPVPDDPTVSFRVWFKVGSQNDPPGKEGLAQLTGLLIAEGATTRNSYPEVIKKLYPLASSYQVRVDKEMSVLSGRTHRDNLDRFYVLFTDAYLRPAFAQDDFERHRTNLLNFLEKTLRYASDEELGKAALYAAVFQGTGYRHPGATVQGLKALTVEDVKAFYQRHYTRDNAVAALGGGYPQELVQRFETSLAELPEGRPEPLPPPQPEPFTGRHLLLVAKPGADASISFGFPIAVHRGERDFYALWIANSWLGEHRNSASHLYQVIRERRGMNYGDYSYIEAYPEGGVRQMPPTNVARQQQLFEVWIRTLPNSQAHFALRAAVRELQKLVDGGMTREQLELTRSFLSKYSLHFATTTADRLGYAVDDRFYGLDGEGHLSRFRRLMGELTLEEVNAAIKKHLQYQNLKIAIVTGEAEALEEALVSDAPSPMTYASQKPPELLAEDEEIAAYPLAIPEENVTIVPVEEIFDK